MPSAWKQGTGCEGFKSEKEKRRAGVGGMAAGIFTDVYLCDVGGYPSLSHTQEILRLGLPLA